MLVVPFYRGMGMGNQLANYAAVRSLAESKGFDWGIMYPENFKGASFMALDMGKPVTGGVIPVEGQPPTELPEGITSYWRENTVRNAENADISPVDESFFEIGDNTLIHGLLQAEAYFEPSRRVLDGWLKVRPLAMTDNVCVINFRGGEYRYEPDFFLPKSYWDTAIEKMLEERPDMRFEVHTDDWEEARKFFPDFPIVQDIGLNWRTIRHAHYLILSNSTFAILPALLNDRAKRIIAPYGFGRYNREYWSLPQNQYRGFEYLKKDGTIWKKDTA